VNYSEFSISVKYFSTFNASASGWRQNGTEMGGEVIVELKSQWKTFPIKKRINTELFIYGEGETLYTKLKEGSDHENSGPLRRGYHKMVGKYYSGSENNGSLFR